MKVFLSWSGNRSKAVAEALRDWLPMVLQNVEPWLSERDVAAGERWSLELTKELDASKFGIICLTRDNMNAPWLMFESGALSKELMASSVCPYTLDLEFSDITGPLSQFQSKKAEKTPTLEILQAINAKCPKPIDNATLEEVFDALWTKLEQRLRKISPTESSGKLHRSAQDILEELVAAVRGLEHRLTQFEAKHEASKLAAKTYVKIIVKADVGKLRQGRTINVAAGNQNFVESIARIAEVNPMDYETHWHLWDSTKRKTLTLKDCENITTYFDGTEPVLSLDDPNDIPF